MTEQATSITDRLSQAGSPRLHPQWEQKNGYYVATCRASPDDIPQLIKIACKWSDPDWPDEDSDRVGDSDEVDLLPVTAWRTLADLKCSEAVEPLIGMLCELDEYDDWSLGDLPHVFGKIGEPAIEALVRLANDAEQQEFVRSIAVEGLRWVAEYYPEARKEIVVHLTKLLTNASHNVIELNSTVLFTLVDLQAVEAAEAIEEAFSRNRLDIGMIGDWEAVRQKLGVEGLGLEMPKHPHNSTKQFRIRMGMGIFSDDRIFGEDGCIEAAEEAYYKRAESLFSQSKEAEQVLESYGELRWFRMFLEFGTRYLGEVVDRMSLNSVTEFVFEYVPRKVSTEAESAASIILELTKFWEYLQRVYNLPAAKQIIEWLSTDGLVDELKTELANPANFGMAKSMVMAGISAGYDMSSEQGVAEFIAVYNRSLLPPAGLPSSGTIVSSQRRVGRNDPCPCGSGKKYKKCCLRGA